MFVWVRVLASWFGLGCGVWGLGFGLGFGDSWYRCFVGFLVVYGVASYLIPNTSCRELCGVVVWLWAQAQAQAQARVTSDIVVLTDQLE